MISNKFREEKSYVICGRFFTGRGMYWRSTKAGESTGGAERSGARGGLTTTRGALLGTAIGAPPEGAMQPIRRNAPIRRLIQPANHDMFAMHKCRDHRRILSKHALDEFCWIFRMETPLLSLVCLDDARHEKSEPSRGADIVICHRCAQRRHAHRHAPKSLLHRGKHRPYTHRLVLHNAQSTTRHREPNLMTPVP